MSRIRMTLTLSLIVFLICYGVIWHHLHGLRKDMIDVDSFAYITPSKILGPASLEFKGLVSDFLFLKLITSIGEKIGKQEELNQHHSRYIYETSGVITDLDPWFWDAYLFSSMSLSWGFAKFKKANELLSKAKIYRVNDYKPPYYIGFNYFYFLRDNSTAAKYLMEAAQLPECPNYVPSLASRLSVYSLEHETAILFLKEMLKKTRNKNIKKQLTLRLDTLEILMYLEEKVDAFKKYFGRYPTTITEMVEKKIIISIPDDPYGGAFYILDKNRVYTTSKMRLEK